MDLLRPLTLAAIPAAVLAMPDAAVRYSRHPVAVLPWIDPWADEEALAASLREFAAGRPEQVVAMPEGDGELVALSRQRDRLDGAVLHALPDRELVEDLVDKSRFSALAQRVGLRVPAAQRIDPGPATAADLDLPFPLVVKPVLRMPEPWKSIERAAKARQVESRAELDRLWDGLASHGAPLLAQRIVPGPETAIESYHAYVDRAGSVVAEFTGRKIRTLPSRFGQSSAVRITDEADVVALGREVVERLGLTGVLKADFKRAPDGTLWLLEINPRFTLWHHPAALGGQNVPAIVYADLLGLPRPPVERPRPGVTWVHPILDLRAAREQGVGVVEWLRFVARCEAVSGMALDDPRPVLHRALAPLRRRPG